MLGADAAPTAGPAVATIAGGGDPARRRLPIQPSMPPSAAAATAPAASSTTSRRGGRTGVAGTMVALLITCGAISALAEGSSSDDGRMVCSSGNTARTARASSGRVSSPRLTT